MSARRRAEDAATLLPLAGAALILLPLVWRGDGGASTGVIMLWLLLVWLALIGAGAALGRRLLQE